MHSFKELNIEPNTKGFIGDKIKIGKVLNVEITILAYKIGPSQYKGLRLDMQIELKGTKHVTWTGSNGLMEVIQKVPPEKFPFTATIVEDNKRLFFT